jgi:hypothetical protein
MAERFKAAVLKTVDREVRGFESLSLRHFEPRPCATAFEAATQILGTYAGNSHGKHQPALLSRTEHD